MEKREHSGGRYELERKRKIKTLGGEREAWGKVI